MKRIYADIVVGSKHKETEFDREDQLEDHIDRTHGLTVAWETDEVDGDFGVSYELWDSDDMKGYVILHYSDVGYYDRRYP